MRVAFIGLGVMGFPMAGHLAEKGHSVTVYNRTREKAEAWNGKYAGRMASTPSEAAANAEVVFSCVGNDDDVREVLIGKDGALASTSAGSIIVDHTTASADVAREVAEVCSRKSVGFLDAPLSGGEAGAVSGQLTIMVGGEPAVFERAKLAMASYAKAMTLVGGVGTGQIAKMVNQICIAGVVQGLAEALHFAKRADIDVEKVIAAISKGAAQSWQMENRWEAMIRNEFDFGFAVDWMRKDLGIALDEAEKNGATLEMTRLVDKFYSEIQAMDGNRWDTSSLIARLEK